MLTFLLEENEKVEGVKFDLFSIDTDEKSETDYRNSAIYTIHKSSFVKCVDRVADKIYRTIPWPVSVKRFFDRDILAKFKEVLTQNDYDYDIIVVENQMSLAVKFLDSGLAKDSRVFFHMHNDIDIYRSPASCRKLTEYGVVFLSVSEFIKKRILDYAQNADVRVLYNGTDTDAFDIKLVEGSEKTRTELGLRPDETVFLFSGRVIPQKGVMELIDGFKDFIARNPNENCKLLIVGFSDIPTKYEAMVLEKCRNLSETVICHNKVNAGRMAEILACSDVMVITTVIEEAFCMAATEAMAMAKPIIATLSGALPEILTEDNSVMISKGSTMVGELSKAFERLSDSILRAKMGKRSFEIFSGKGNWHKDSYYKNFCDIVGVNDGIKSM
ncbi:MAG: glycosyltransferase family 4 protein [Lachnospiraceae bacterium]|nr:glycosyltransferase family 4 protein [Lachnospiraceae bacterium]